MLPKQLRTRLGLRPGDELTITEDADGVVRLESRRTAARALIGSAGSARHSVVDELREQRRQQTVAEDRQARRARA